MPTYDYKCKLCNKEHEIFHSISAKPEKKCPSCGKAGLERMVSLGAGIIFKGGGFYETDYKRKSPSAEKKISNASAATKAPCKAEASGGKCGCAGS